MIEMGENQLIDKENLFKAIYNDSPIGIELYNSNGKLIDLNQACLELFGVSNKEEVKGFDLLSDPNIPKEHLNKLKQRESVHFESAFEFDVVKKHKLYKTKKSGKVYLDVLITPLFLGDNKSISNYLVQIQDITVQKIAEQKLINLNEELENRIQEKIRELKKSDANWPILVEEAPDIIFTVDRNRRILYINKVPSGITREESIEKDVLDYVSPEYHNIVKNTIEKVFQTGEPDFYEVSARGPNDVSSWYSTRLGAIKQDDKVVSVMLITRDITERKEIEQQLIESEEKFRSITEQSIMGICIVQDDIVKYANHQIADIYGYSIEEIMNWSPYEFLKLIDPEYRDIVVEQAKKKQLGQDDVNIHYQLKCIKKTGEKIWVENFSRTINYNGKPADLVTLIDITEEKKAEEQLKESEENFRTITEQSLMGIAILQDDRFHYVNKQFADIFRYTPEEMTNWGKLEYAKLIHPDDREMALEQARKKQLGLPGAVIHYQFRGITKKGKVKWLEIYSNSINYRDESADLITIVDITGKKEAERKLKESEERFKYLVSSSPTIIYTSKASGDYGATFISSNVEEKWGYDPDIFVHDSEFWLNHIHPDDREHVLALLSDLYEKDNIIHEYRFKLNDGNYHWMRDEITLVRDDSGNPIEIIGSTIDITDRVEAELELKNSEEKFRTIAEQSSLGMIIQQDGFIKFANSAVSDIIEYPLEKIHKWTAEETLQFIYKEDLPLIIDKLKQRQEGDFESINQYECRAITKSGKIKWINVYTKPIIYQGKNAVLSTFMDITEKKKVEEELKEVSRLKSDLISRTSHELKTPLVSIKGYADLLLSQHYEELDFYTISVLHEIKQGCYRLESLIKDLLETSELETGEVELNKLKDDLAFLIRFCVKDLKGLIETRKHNLILDIPENLVTLFEKERLYEVVINLLSNAIKYTPPNGRIIIKSESKDDNYIISITDNGIGLTNEEKEKIFKKFGKIERYGKGLDVVSEGSGLGLYISKKIIELHGGDIWVESKGREKGSKFSFSIPILKA